MRFNVDLVAEQVADRVIGKIDANPHPFLNTDFNSIGDCVEVLSSELQFLLDGGLKITGFQNLVEELYHHKDIQMMFDTAGRMMDEYKAYREQAEAELQEQEINYRRDVL